MEDTAQKAVPGRGLTTEYLESVLALAGRYMTREQFGRLHREAMAMAGGRISRPPKRDAGADACKAAVLEAIADGPPIGVPLGVAINRAVDAAGILLDLYAEAAVKAHVEAAGDVPATVHVVGVAGDDCALVKTGDVWGVRFFAIAGGHAEKVAFVASDGGAILAPDLDLAEDVATLDALEAALLKALWSGEFVNKLPDNAFALILPGGEKDDGGLTKPRSLRMFPHHTFGVKSGDDDSAVDLPHLRNALSRLLQAKITGEQRAKVEAHLRGHMKRIQADAKKAALRFALTKGRPEGERRIVTGVILEPERVMALAADGFVDVVGADEIEKAAYGFMVNGGAMRRDHATAQPGVRVVESYVAPCDMTINGESIKKGSWIMSVFVADDRLWKDIKDGRVTGFSVGGTTAREIALEYADAA